MDKIINQQIDSVEELERQLNIIIEHEISKIDIDMIVVSPQEELEIVKENVKRIFLDEYADKALELGFDFGRKINKKITEDKTIKVDKSKNPTLNE